MNEKTPLIPNHVARIQSPAEMTAPLIAINEPASNLSRLTNLENLTPTNSFNTGIKWGSRIGFTLTIISMIIQGVLAFLLWELLWRNIGNRASPLVYESVLYFVGVLLFIGSVVGKVALVNLYNHLTFEAIGAETEKLVRFPKLWIKDRRNSLRLWNISDVLLALPNGIMTVNVSLVFGLGLTNLGVNGVAQILRTYNKEILNHVANVITTSSFQAPFVIATVICNLLAFPYIHMNAIAMFKNIARWLITNPAYRCLMSDIESCLLAANLKWKEYAENHAVVGINNMMNALFNPSAIEQFELNGYPMLEDQVNSIGGKKIDLASLITFGRTHITLIKPEYGLEFVTTRSAAIVILGAVVWGLSNFIEMSKETMDLMHLPYLGVASGISTYISMFCISADAVFSPTVDFLRYLFFGRDYSAQILHGYTRFGLAAIIAVLIWLGGFPNGSQEAHIGGNVLDISIAVFAVWIEIFPTYGLLKSFVENAKLKSDLYAKLVNHVKDQIESEVKSLYSHDITMIKALAIEHVAPEQAEKIQVLTAERKSVIKISNVMSQLFWKSNALISDNASNHDKVVSPQHALYGASIV